MGRFVLVLTLAGLLQAGPARAHDYPTETLADYVFGCMASNGQSRNMLNLCSCSIDVIASILPYERYVQADTILRMRQISGEKGSVFKTVPHYKAIIDDLKRAQVEAEIRCF